MRIWNVSLLVIMFLLGGINIGQSQDEASSEEKVGIKVKPTVALHGRIQYDFEFLRMKDGVEQGEDYSLNGNEFRRLYLSGSGKIYKNLKYKAQIEFAGGKVSYRDVFIKFTDLPGIGGNVYVGSFAEPTGLDMTTSSKYIPFLERAMLTSTQNFRWNSGFMYDNFNWLDGKIGVQLSYTFNGKADDGFKDKNLESGGHFVTRLTTPIKFGNDNLIHLGVNYEYRKRSADAKDYTLKFRPENHMGFKVQVPFELLESQNDVGFEFAAIYGKFSFQGEYELAGYKTAADSYTLNNYYGAITYFITGGKRSYKKGTFSRVKPFNNFCITDHEWGAIELVARYSKMDYTKVITTGHDDQVGDITVGFNWYLNSHTKLMYNYILSDFNQEGDNNKLSANLIRLQVDF